MDFTLTDEQELLVDSATRWARGVRSAGEHRNVVAGKPSPTSDLWQALVDYGWVGITTAIEKSGSGGTLVDACLVIEVFQRELVPLPYATNAVLVPAAVRAFGAGDDIESILATGVRRAGLGVGAELMVPGGALAWEWTDGDAVAVVGPSGVELLDPSVIVGTTGWDLLHPLGVVGSGVVGSGVVGSGRTLDVTSIETPAWYLATVDVVSCAALVGLMEGAMRLAIEYAKNRVQFGRPIGSFQAIQHLCAEMYVDVEAARVAYLGAASLVETNQPEACFTAAVAKAWCAEASVRVTETAIQVLGGIGNTWESDAHLYLRGCHQWSRLGGGLDASLDTVALTLFDQVEPTR